MKLLWKAAVLEVGVQSHPQKFKFAENLSKIPENPGRSGAQRCLTSKTGTRGLQKNTWRPVFGGHINKRSSWSLWKKICRENCTLKFLGKFGEIWAKILRTPKNLPARTPMMKITSASIAPFWKGRWENVPAIPPFSGIPVHIVLHSHYSL